jgi:hypothetical protein
MINILIITTAIAAFLTIRAMCDAVKAMRYEELKAKHSRMTLLEMREELEKQYVTQCMREIYERGL